MSARSRKPLWWPGPPERPGAGLVVDAFPGQDHRHLLPVGGVGRAEARGEPPLLDEHPRVVHGENEEPEGLQAQEQIAR